MKKTNKLCYLDTFCYGDSKMIVKLLAIIHIIILLRNIEEVSSVKGKRVKVIGGAVVLWKCSRWGC